MAGFGGFDHNVQTFRVVTELERRYPAFPGLNLTWETLEGVVKHNGPVSGRLERAGLEARSSTSTPSFRPASWAAGPRPRRRSRRISDDIAYNNHDVDDGLQAGLFRLDDLEDVPLIGPILARRARRLAGPRRPADPAGGGAADDRRDGRRRAGRDRAPRAAGQGRDPPTTCAASARRWSPSRPTWSRTWRGCAPSCTSACTGTGASTAPAARRAASWPSMFELFLAEPDVLPSEWGPTAHGGRRGRPGAGRLRLHRRHDRPLRHRGAPQAVSA